MNVLALKRVHALFPLLLLLLCGSQSVFAADVAPAAGEDAGALRGRYAALALQLTNNQFQRPLYLESHETSESLKGDIYAVIEQPYGIVAPALQGADHWCDILILHLNVKNCQASRVPGTGEILRVAIGRKYDIPLADAYSIDFDYRVGAANADYLQVRLSAESGPMGTSNYHIIVEAVPLDQRRTFLHLTYSYAYGTTARLAMAVYLATIGRSKVGFTIVERRAGGQPAYIGGVRGVIERNAMRYYLAIEAYLGAVNLPLAEQLERRLQGWYTAIERYPVQLHELERSEYIDMKHREVQRHHVDAGHVHTE